MRTLPLFVSGTVAAASLAVVGTVVTATVAHAAPAETAYALSGTSLLSFPVADPADVDTTPITGVVAGESLVGIDVRPQNGQLYALGVDAGSNHGTLYVLHEQSGYAAPVGAPGGIAFTSDGVTAVDLPDPAVVGYGFDVNPAADRIRVVAGALNFRVNPNTGVGIDGDNTGSTTGVVSGTNPDASINGTTTSLDGSAYTNDVANNGNITTLYGLDASSNTLTRAASPNAGQQASAVDVTLAGSPLDFGSVGGFDVAPGVDAPSSNTAVTSGSAHVVLSVGGAAGLYAINLVSGAATLLGTVGDGTLPVQGLALQRDADEGYPAIGLSQDSTTLVRFSTTSPGAPTSQAISNVNLVSGETIAAIAWRPQTGQLLGIGVDPTTDTATLYLVDPQIGALARIGTPGGIAWTQDGVAPTALADPTTTGWGLTVDPISDRLRVTDGDGLNARVTPTGQGVDGNLGQATSVTGTNPDGAAAVAVVAPAYTNPWGRSLPSTDPATLYVLDPGGNRLLVQSPPVSGTLVSGRPVTLGGSTLDFKEFVGMAIPEGVRVTSPGATASGRAYAVLTVAGQAGAYAIDLATGRATSLGDMSTTLRSLVVGAAGVDRPVAAPPAEPAVLAKVAKPRQVRKVVDSGRVQRCPVGFKAATCTTKVRVVASYRVKVRGKVRTRQAVVAVQTVRTARGKESRIKPQLSRKGVRLLRQRGRLTARILIAAPTGPKGAVRTTTVRIVLRKARL